MLHITVACYFSTPNLIYTPILKARALNLALYLKAQALNLALYLKAQTLNLTLYLKAQALNLALYLKTQALNLALFLKAQALNLTLTPFTYPIFKYKLSKVTKNIYIKPTNNLITKELRNPDSLSLIEIHMSEVKSLSGPLKKKVFFVCYYLHFISSFGKSKYSRKSHSFTHLIKGTAVGRTLWGASTFPTRNRLPDSKSGFVNLPYLVFGFP